MSKGPQFERDVCRQLSLWWTAGKRDDVFWRTHGSGARATARHKAGKKTAGQYGDIAASDPIGAPLIQKIVWSLKRGYSRATLHDLLDCTKNSARPKWAEWIAEIREVRRQAELLHWAIIARRDRRESLLVTPPRTLRLFGIAPDMYILNIAVIRFPDFLKNANPEKIKAAAGD